MKTLALNKKALFNYEVLEEYLAGLKLEGREIKSLRHNKASFAGSYVTVSHGKPMLHALNIPRYKYDSLPDYDPKRTRLLLLKKNEIDRIEGKLKEQGVTLVPIEIGLDRQWAKIKIAIVRGKKLYDKRQKIKERDQKREIQRVVKGRR